MDLGAHIRDIIIVANEMKKAIGVDKKALNKTIARLEEAELWARQINTGRVDASGGQRDACTCSPGVRDGGCPVHGGGGVMAGGRQEGQNGSLRSVVA